MLAPVATQRPWERTALRRHSELGALRLSVLLVEESAEDRARLGELLRQTCGEQTAITGCTTGLEALEHLRRRRVDLVLINSVLPDTTGVQLVSEIADLADDTAIILMSGQGNARLAAEAIKQGARDYLVKRELSPDALGEAILAALRTARVEWRASQLVRQLRQNQQQMERCVKNISQGLKSSIAELQESVRELRSTCREAPAHTLDDLARVERDIRQSQLELSNLGRRAQPQAE
jgi:PleD family two-component response regulator